MIRYFNAYVLYPLLEKKSGRQIQSKLQELKRFSSLTPDEKDRVRKTELVKILERSRHSVPYYRDLFEKVSFSEQRVMKDLRYLQDLPLLTKDIIRENQDRLRLPGAHHVRKTGGSTGQSVFFYYDDVGLDWTAAINLLAYEMAGNFPYKTDCHISSELGMAQPPMKHRMLDTLKLFSQNRKRLMIRSFSDADLKESFSQLKAIRPYLMQGHPSSAYALANYVKEHRLNTRKFCAVFEPSGEMLTDKMVETIEKYLGCKVVNRYGNAEFGVMAHTRPEDLYNKLLVFDRAFYIEEVTQNNLIVTNLTNYSFPLFRYDTGDVATVKRETDGTFIYDIQGRVHDLVRIDQEDYATHYIMDYLDHKIRNIREFQILITHEPLPILNVVPENDADRERIYTQLKQRWPVGIEIKFIGYHELRKVGWQQKFRHVIDLRGASV